MDFMLELLFYIIIFLVVTFVLTILLPLVATIIANRNLKDELKYDFPQKLIDKDYSDTKFFEDNKREFEGKKKEVISKKMP